MQERADDIESRPGDRIVRRETLESADQDDMRCQRDDPGRQHVIAIPHRLGVDQLVALIRRHLVRRPARQDVQNDLADDPENDRDDDQLEDQRSHGRAINVTAFGHRKDD